jgi:hypothetical protein
MAGIVALATLLVVVGAALAVGAVTIGAAGRICPGIAAEVGRGYPAIDADLSRRAAIAPDTEPAAFVAGSVTALLSFGTAEIGAGPGRGTAGTVDAAFVVATAGLLSILAIADAIWRAALVAVDADLVGRAAGIEGDRPVWTDAWRRTTFV